MEIHQVLFVASMGVAAYMLLEKVKTFKELGVKVAVIGVAVISAYPMLSTKPASNQAGGNTNAVTTQQPDSFFNECEIKEETEDKARCWAIKHGIDADLIIAMMMQESAGHVFAVSRAGAGGLLQLMPDTAKGECGLNKVELYHPDRNLDCGIRYFKKMLSLFGNDVRLALCAYNAGPNAVKKYGNNCPPYRETQDYQERIIAKWQALREQHNTQIVNAN